MFTFQVKAPLLAPFLSVWSLNSPLFFENHTTLTTVYFLYLKVRFVFVEFKKKKTKINKGWQEDSADIDRDTGHHS